jgi:hypothetical protein
LLLYDPGIVGVEKSGSGGDYPVKEFVTLDMFYAFPEDYVADPISLFSEGFTDSCGSNRVLRSFSLFQARD